MVIKTLRELVRRLRRAPALRRLEFERDGVPMGWVRDLRPDEWPRDVGNATPRSADFWEQRSRARGHVPRGWRL